MKIIIKGRGQGKTTELVQLAIKTGATIITFSRQEAKRVEDLLRDLNLENCPRVTTFEAFVAKRAPGYEQPYVIDNLDLCLQQFAGRNKILAATLTDEG